ncbi:hypothetical protein [Butyrivibrio sp. MC2013]|uniref:hypothetical protein n=1 Tax=Butyrivibrio sp. MC2013 TaxID=1280686 RepID=UPI0004018C59|nr:hypothetical protein [Butyrivibrio sp. MC2013]
MEFKQELETGTLKMIGNDSSAFKIRDVADKCRLNQTDNGLKVELNYTGPNASAYLQYVDKHTEELTEYLMNPDVADFYEWMEVSHQTPITLKRHEKETLIIYINFDPVSKLMEAGISDENITMKLGAPLVSVNITELDRNAFKLKIYDMLLLADEIALSMGNDNLHKMANIEMVKTYLREIYDKYTSKVEY